MSAAPQYINAHEFAEYLRDNNLFIVSGDELEHGKLVRQREEQRRLMRRKAISLSEAINAKLLPLTSRNGLRTWINEGKIKEGEAYQETKGHKRWMVLTSAIKRLGFYND